MNTPSPILRNYKISDDAMLQDSRTTVTLFTTDAAAFISLDEDFKPPFATNWNDAITQAGSALSDEQIIDTQTVLSEDVEKAMEDCRTHFQAAKYYIEKAFPNKKGVWNEFGYDNYDAARKSPEKMVTFMDVFDRVAIKYKTQLFAAKYTQASIDAIATKRQALIDAKTNQEVAKNSRLGFTQNRIALLNTVWGFRTQVARAAKNIFANDFAKYKMYLLPASDEATNTFSIEGVVTDKATGNVLENVLVSYGTPANDTTSDSNGKYGFAQLSNGDYTLTFTLTGYKTATLHITYDGTTVEANAELEK